MKSLAWQAAQVPALAGDGYGTASVSEVWQALQASVVR